MSEQAVPSAGRAGMARSVSWKRSEAVADGRGSAGRRGRLGRAASASKPERKTLVGPLSPSGESLSLASS